MIDIDVNAEVISKFILIGCPRKSIAAANPNAQKKVNPNVTATATATVFSWTRYN